MTTCFQTVYTNKLGQANLIEIEAVDDNSVSPHQVYHTSLVNLMLFSSLTQHPTNMWPITITIKTLHLSLDSNHQSTVTNHLNKSTSKYVCISLSDHQSRNAHQSLKTVTLLRLPTRTWWRRWTGRRRCPRRSSTTGRWRSRRSSWSPGWLCKTSPFLPAPLLSLLQRFQ